MSSKLQIDSVQKTKGNRLILSDVYLNCNTGEVVGILGRNGSGKSTLLELIVGGSSAEIFLSVNDKRIFKPYQSGLFAYLPQNSFLPKSLSVKTVIDLTTHAINKNTFDNDVFLKGLSGKKISELSGGELRYLEFMTVIHSKGHFILLDEPFSKISPVLAEQMLKTIQEQSALKAIIVTDHFYDIILKISSRIILLNGGKTYPIDNIQDLYLHNYL